MSQNSRRSYDINKLGDLEAAKASNSISSDSSSSLSLFTGQKKHSIAEVDSELAVEQQRIIPDLRSTEELSLLRSNINLMADRLQTLLQREELAASSARLLNQITLRLRESRTPQEVCATAVEEGREALGADRVIVYAFDPDWKGHIIAESVASGWKSSLGQKIADPCFAQRYVQSYQRGRISATENIYEADLTECHIKQLAVYDVKANLVVPLLVNQKLFGLLIAHQCSSPRVWDKSEIEFFSQLSVQVGYALNQVILLRKQASTAQQARLLNQISSRIRESLQTEDIFNVAVVETRTILKADRVIVYTFDEHWKGTVVAESLVGSWKASLGDPIDDPCFAQRYVQAYQKGRVSATPNIAKAGLTECHLQQLEPYGVKANLVVPIVAKRKLYGLLIAHQCSAPRKWKDSEIDFFKQVGIQVGFALDQALLLEEQTIATKQAQLLNQITSRLRQSLKRETMFDTAVEDARQALEADRVIVYTFDPKWQGTVVAESVVRPWKSALGAKIADPCFADRYVRHYQRGGYSATANIQEAGLTQCHLNQLKPFEVQANLVVPIVADRNLYGLLIAHQCSAPRKWKPWEIEFFRQVAVQVGFALDLALLIEAQQAATEQANLLNEITFNIRENLDPDKIFHVTVQKTRKAFKVDRAVIYRFDEDFNGKIVAESVGGNWHSIINNPEDVPCFPLNYIEEYEQGSFCVINNLAEASLTECHAKKMEEWQVKANVVVPILLKEKLYGLLGIHQCSEPRIWQDSEVKLLQQIGTQVAYALDQAILLEEVQRARSQAETLSQSQSEQQEILQNQIRTFMRDIEGSFDGDLTVRARVIEGEMGTVADFFNSTIENLQDLVLQVKESTTEVSQTVQDSEGQVGQVSQEALRQAESIVAAMANIQAIANSIQEVANNAQVAKLKVEEGNQTIEAGERVMNDTVTSIKTVQQTVEKTAKKVKRLGEASQNISRIVNLIQDIAKQTNILALNASIEAKHTGEGGQDFSVIATEVRNLAEQSAEATKEIEQIVSQIQAETADAVSAMEVGQSQVNHSALLVEETRKKLSQITTVSSQIRQIVKATVQIATSEVQTAANVSKTMQDVEAIAKETSTQSKVLAGSFAKLLDVAGTLQESVAQFKVQ
jgi:methyl-accepting chemotaxis protein PixJ